MLLQEASENWDFQNVCYGTSALLKIYLLVLFAICVVVCVKLVRAWRTAPPFRLERQAQNPAYKWLLQKTETSLSQWMSFTVLCWGIFISISLYNWCVQLLNQKAFVPVLLINIILGFSTASTAALLVVLFGFIARWHVVKRIDHLHSSW
jgi:uncharacterized membrane protein (DUF485 family)